MGGFPIPQADGSGEIRIEMDGDPANSLRGDGVCRPSSGSGGALSVRTVITAAQLKSMRAVPVEIVPAPGVGKYIRPLAITLQYRFLSVAFTVPAGAGGQINMVANPADFTFNVSFANFLDQVSNQVQDFSQTSNLFGPQTDADNSAIQATLTGGAGELTLGDGSLAVTVVYALIDLT